MRSTDLGDSGRFVTGWQMTFSVDCYQQWIRSQPDYHIHKMLNITIHKDLDEDINGVIIKFWTAESKLKKYFGKVWQITR